MPKIGEWIKKKKQVSEYTILVPLPGVKAVVI